MHRDDTADSRAESSERPPGRSRSRDGPGRRLRRHTSHSADRDDDTPESGLLARDDTSRARASVSDGTGFASGGTEPLRRSRRESGPSDASVRDDAPTTDSRQLVVGSPDSRYEREAERIARQVTATQHGSPDTDAIDDEVSSVSSQLQRSTTAAGDSAGRAPESVRDVISSPGQSLDAGVRRRMESAMGVNFGDVAVHTGPDAAQSTDDVNARAYTVGSDVVFDSGEYAPGTPEGDSVIAHELAHVAQQSRGSPRVQRQPTTQQSRQPTTQQSRQTTTQQPQENDRYGAQTAAQQFVDNEYETLWYEVNHEARKELDVSKSGTSDSGGEVWWANKTRKRARERAKQRARTNVDAALAQSQQTTQRGQGDALDDLIKNKQRKIQKDATKTAETEAVKSVDAELAKVADEKTSELLDGHTVRAAFAGAFKSAVNGRAASTAKQYNNAYNKARKQTLKKFKSEVPTRLPGQEELAQRAEKRVDDDQVATKAVTTTEESAADAFQTIGKRIDNNVGPGEKTSITVSIGIRPDPEVPVSIDLTGSVAASREPEDTDGEGGDLTVDASIKLGVSADINIASVGFNVRKLVRAGGMQTQTTMTALSYALYRHYMGKASYDQVTGRKKAFSGTGSTEWLTNLVWGGGQDGDEPYRLKAQRWAAAAEQKLDSDEKAFGMVGSGVDIHGKAGVEQGPASGSISAQLSHDYFEQYDRDIIKKQLGSMAGAVVTDSNRRRRLEKDRAREATVNETNVSVKLSGDLSLPVASAGFDIKGAYSRSGESKITDGSQSSGAPARENTAAHTVTLGGSVKAPGLTALTNVALPLTDKLLEGYDALKRKMSGQTAESRSDATASSGGAKKGIGRVFETVLAMSTTSTTRDKEGKLAGNALKEAQKDTALDRAENANLPEKPDAFATDAKDAAADSTGAVFSGSGGAGFGFAVEFSNFQWGDDQQRAGARDCTVDVFETKNSTFSFDVGYVKGSFSISRNKLLARFSGTPGRLLDQKYIDPRLKKNLRRSGPLSKLDRTE